MSKNLSGKTIVITRPLHQAGILAEKIEALGGKALLFPTLEILPAEDNRGLLKAMQSLSSYQILIFVSANAVQYVLPLAAQPFPRLTTLAIGPGTARALEMGHIPVSWVPALHHSEGLLASPLLKNIEGKKIAIFCGENTRPLLKNELIERGAIVDEVVCYRRRCPYVDAREALNQWKIENINLIISTSSESLFNLWQLFAKIDPEWFLGIPLLVISPTLFARAQQWGFRSVVLAEGASDAAICAAL